jgi:hypothetical protein
MASKNYLAQLVARMTLAAVDFTIASGASLSPAIDLASLGVARIVMPAAWTTANLTFQTSQDGLTYQDLYDAYGVEYTVIAVVAHNIILPPSDFVGMRYLKVRSGTSGSPVTQGGARTVTLITRAF